jgi:hypothetical protein
MDERLSESPAAPSRALTVPPNPEPAVEAVLTEAGKAALDRAAALARHASAPATLRAYRSDWAHYAAWSAPILPA